MLFLNFSIVCLWIRKLYNCLNSIDSRNCFYRALILQAVCSSVFKNRLCAFVYSSILFVITTHVATLSNLTLSIYKNRFQETRVFSTLETYCYNQQSFQVPVMLKSCRCHLQWLSREQLIAHGEEGTEKGGYFICKGSEKVCYLTYINVLLMGF